MSRNKLGMHLLSAYVCFHCPIIHTEMVLILIYLITDDTNSVLSLGNETIVNPISCVSDGFCGDSDVPNACKYFLWSYFIARLHNIDVQNRSVNIKLKIL